MVEGVAVSVVFMMVVLRYQCTIIAVMAKVRFSVVTEFARTRMASSHGSSREMSEVAEAADGVKRARRPVVFLANGNARLASVASG